MANETGKTKRPRGRQSIPESERRTVKVPIAFTKEERFDFEEFALEEGYGSFSAFIRQAAHEVRNRRLQERGLLSLKGKQGKQKEQKK